MISHMNETMLVLVLLRRSRDKHESEGLVQVGQFDKQCVVRTIVARLMNSLSHVV